MSPKQGTRESDPDYFQGDEGALPCTRPKCGRWTGLRDDEGKPRCARHELVEKPTCRACEVDHFDYSRGITSVSRGAAAREGKR